MARAIYTYSIEGRVVCIVDAGLGCSTTVTNDIENVILEIFKKESTIQEIDDYIWIYMDSEGRIDGFGRDPGEGRNFFFIGAYTFEEAIASEQVQQRVKLLPEIE